MPASMALHVSQSPVLAVREGVQAAAARDLAAREAAAREAVATAAEAEAVVRAEATVAATAGAGQGLQ